MFAEKNSRKEAAWSMPSTSETMDFVPIAFRCNKVCLFTIQRIHIRIKSFILINAVHTAQV